MIKHILKVSFRNLLKYRQQSLISIIGLAVGIICFALSTYWIRYEKSFDAFHKNADRIYQVRLIDPNSESGQYLNTPPPLAQVLEKNFPGIKVSTVSTRIYDIEPGNNSKSIQVQEVDKNFFDLFDTSILSGSIDLDDENGILVSETFSKEHYHTDTPIGQELIWYVSGQEYKRLTVRGVIKDWPKNTNLPFQIIRPIDKNDFLKWDDPSMNYILLDKGRNFQAFKEQLEKIEVKEALYTPSYTIVPLKEAYYTDPVYNDSRLKFGQVKLFALLGLLVITSALFNYLNLYVSRIRIRVKELSLRKVTGSSNLGIFTLLSAEFIILLMIASLVGFIGIEWCLPLFKSFADIQSDYIHIYSELSIYILSLIGISVCMVSLVIHHTQCKLFQESVRTVLHPYRKGIFNRISLLLQIIISLGFIYCTTVYYKQIHTLEHAYPGFDRTNILSLSVSASSVSFIDLGNSQNTAIILNELKGISTITQSMPLGQGAILPRLVSSKAFVRTDRMNDNESVEYDQFYVHPDYIGFYGLQLIAGKDFKPSSGENGNDVIINETAAKALGLTDPVGQKITEIPKAFYLPDGKIYQGTYAEEYTIIGVVKDFAYESLITPISPVILSVNPLSTQLEKGIAVKYQPETYEQTKKAITKLVEEKTPGNVAHIFNMENEYKRQYASEDSLRFLFALLTLVCVIISLFGIYSVVTLDCEYHRKEIAIRKVNGASLSSIFYLFFKGYIQLLVIASAIAFSAGYIIITPWIERYILQTEINWWIYPLLFFIVVGIIFFTVFTRIWNTAHINPVEELKKE